MMPSAVRAGLGLVEAVPKLATHVLKSKLANISGTILRWLSSAASISWRIQPLDRRNAPARWESGQEDNKVCPRPYVFQYDSLEITASDAIIVDENIGAMLGKVLEDRQRPWLVGAAIADKTVFSMRPIAACPLAQSVCARHTLKRSRQVR